MRFIDERKPDTVNFEEINVGEVFFAEEVGEYGSTPYIRIFKVQDIVDGWYNAVDLYDGTTTYFHDDEEVIKCEACLTIR